MVPDVRLFLKLSIDGTQRDDVDGRCRFEWEEEVPWIVGRWTGRLEDSFILRHESTDCTHRFYTPKPSDSGGRGCF